MFNIMYIYTKLQDRQVEWSVKRYSYHKQRTCSTEGVAVDWINHMLYWTDSRNKKIEVNDLHRGHRRSLIATGEDTLPRTIIVDPTTR